MSWTRVTFVEKKNSQKTHTQNRNQRPESLVRMFISYLCSLIVQMDRKTCMRCLMCKLLEWLRSKEDCISAVDIKAGPKMLHSTRPTSPHNVATISSRRASCRRCLTCSIYVMNCIEAYVWVCALACVLLIFCLVSTSLYPLRKGCPKFSRVPGEIDVNPEPVGGSSFRGAYSASVSLNQ